jgi:hypothetical protein
MVAYPGTLGKAAGRSIPNRYPRGPASPVKAVLIADVNVSPDIHQVLNFICDLSLHRECQG